MPAPGLTRAILQPSTRGPRAPPASPCSPPPPSAAAAAERGVRLLRRRAHRGRARRRDRAPRRRRARAPAVGRPARRCPTGDAEASSRTPGPSARRTRALVDAMRTRAALPAGAGADAGRRRHGRAAERRDLRVAHLAAPGRAGACASRVVNRDGFARRVSALALHDRARRARRRRLGPLRLDARWTAWTSAARQTPRCRARRCPPGRSRCGSATRTRATRPRRWSSWSTGPRTQSIAPTADVARRRRCTRPIDAAGDHWVTLAGADAVVRLTPAADLGAERAASVSSSPAAGTRADERAAAARAVRRRGRPPRRGVDDARARQRHRPHRPGAAARRHDARRARLPAARVRRGRVPGRLPARPGRAPHAPAAADEGHAGRAGQHARVVHGGQRGPHRPAARGAGRHGARPDALLLRLPGAARPRARPGRRRVVHRGRDATASGASRPTSASPTPPARARLRHYLDPQRRPRRGAGAVAGARWSRRNPHSLAIDRRGLVWFTESATGKLGLPRPERRRARHDGRASGRSTCPRTDFGTAPTPADLTVDRAGTVFWADEYGDIVGTVRRAGRARGLASRAAPSARPPAAASPTRRSSTPPATCGSSRPAPNRITRVVGRERGQPRGRAAARRRTSTWRPTTLAVRGLDGGRDGRRARRCATARGRGRATGVAVQRRRRAVRGWDVAGRAAPRRRRRGAAARRGPAAGVRHCRLPALRRARRRAA